MEAFFPQFYESARVFASEHLVRIVAIIIGAVLAQMLSRRLIGRAVRRLVRQGSGSKLSEEKREDTLIQVIVGAVSILVWLVAGMMLLSEFGVAIGPVLAAAGVAGIAVGFGGQYLIRDLISGAFVILENQYRAGDVVCFGATCGLVERITLRMTTLRDLDGTVHHVPHGEIKTVSNLSKDFSRVNINVGVPYSADLEHVIQVVNRVGEELAQDPEWKEHVLTPPAFLRVNEFADSAVMIKILGDTAPIKQWDVAGELRKRIKMAFDREGIAIPLPQRVVHAAEAPGKKERPSKLKEA
jgi:small conductance mechanosensitive channel